MRGGEAAIDSDRVGHIAIIEQSVSGHCFGLLYRIGDQLGIKRATMPIFLLVRHDLSFRAERGICSFFLQRFGFLIDHLSRNAGIFNPGVPVRKTPPLFFFFLRCRDVLSGFVKKFLQTVGHNSPSDITHFTTAGAEENRGSHASGTRVLPALFHFSAGVLALDPKRDRAVEAHLSNGARGGAPGILARASVWTGYLRISMQRQMVHTVCRRICSVCRAGHAEPRCSPNPLILRYA